MSGIAVRLLKGREVIISLRFRLISKRINNIFENSTQLYHWYKRKDKLCSNY